MTIQGEGIVWFNNISLVKVLQGSLILFQHPFDISTSPQGGCIVWFKNMSLVELL